MQITKNAPDITSTTPVMLCLAGFFLHIMLSDPVLSLLGFHYSGEEGQFWEKIHPGTYCIFLGFAVLVFMQRSALLQLMLLFQQQRAAMALLIFYVIALSYMALRSGVHGLAFILDTHISAVCCAIILSYAKPSAARFAIATFIVMALLNGGVGITEAIGKFRLFTYDPSWAVLHEEYFRASALRGHPLDNTAFTIIALCVALHTRLNVFLKALLSLFFLASVLAFGGRVGATFALLTLSCFVFRECAVRLRSPDLNMREFLHVTLICVAVLFCVLLVFYLCFISGAAERIATQSHWDDSANSRLLAFHIFDYLSAPDMWLGISTERILDITWRMHIRYGLSDIENPWLLMFLYLGGVLFPFWLISLSAFILRLMHHTSLGLKLAVMGYFIIASTANSFGRKDSTFLIMVCAVICAGRMLPPKNGAAC